MPQHWSRRPSDWRPCDADADADGDAIDSTGISVRAQALRALRTTVHRARLVGYNNGYVDVPDARRADPRR